MNVLCDNIYQNFIDKYYDDFVFLAKRFHTNNENVLFVDMDTYKRCNEIKSSVFLSPIKNLPDYARSKVTEIRNSADSSIVLAINHLGLCLITSIL